MPPGLQKSLFKQISWEPEGHWLFFLGRSKFRLLPIFPAVPPQFFPFYASDLFLNSSPLLI